MLMIKIIVVVMIMSKIIIMWLMWFILSACSCTTMANAPFFYSTFLRLLCHPYICFALFFASFYHTRILSTQRRSFPAARVSS